MDDLKQTLPIVVKAIGEEEVNSVDARLLHEALGVSTRYNDWIKNRISKYGFIENEDFICLTENLVTQRNDGQQGVAKQTVHFLTIDCAKELAMVQNNEIGRKVRKYFIERDKELSRKERTPALPLKQQCFLEIIDASSQEEIVLGLNKLNNGVIKPLEAKIEEMAPKAEFHDSVMLTEHTMDIGKTSKILNFKGLGRNNLYKYLRTKGIINDKNIPYQQYITQGYMKLVETSVKPVFFQKGLDWLNKKLISEGYQKNKQ